MVKNLYCGVFAMKRESFISYAYAYSEKQAMCVFCRRIAKKHNVSNYMVRDYINSNPGCYKITKEIEFKEEENENQD